MAIFTGTPVETVPSYPFLWIHDPPNSTGGTSGPFHYGGAMYLVGFEQAVSDGVVIAKSTDAGATWLYFFQGAAPENWTGFQDVVLDTPGDRLVFLALEAGAVNGNIASFNFDLVTETFSAPISYPTAGIFNGSHPFVLAQRPNGDILAIYSQALGSLRALMGVTINPNLSGIPGAFGTAFVIDAGTGTEKLKARSAISDSSGIIHIVYSESTANTLYITIDAANVPGTRQTISGSFYYLSNAIISATFDAIVVDVTNSTPKKFFVGTPISAPVWTQYTVPAPGGSIADWSSCVVDNGSTLKFVYGRKESGVSMVLMQVEWNGTLGTPVVYWDMVANRAPGAVGLPVADLNFAGLTAALYANVLEVASTTVINSSDDYTAVYVSTSGTPAVQSGYQNKFY